MDESDQDTCSSESTEQDDLGYGDSEDDFEEAEPGEGGFPESDHFEEDIKVEEVLQRSEGQFDARGESESSETRKHVCVQLCTGQVWLVNDAGTSITPGPKFSQAPLAGFTSEQLANIAADHASAASSSTDSIDIR